MDREDRRLLKELVLGVVTVIILLTIYNKVVEPRLKTCDRCQDCRLSGHAPNVN